MVQAGWTDLWATIAQAVFRGLLGWTSGSMGLVVQGLYSIGDALAKGITLVSVHIAKRPPSKTFPFGFGKILFVSSLTIGVGLLLGGVSLGLTSFRDMASIHAAPSLLTVLGVVLSASASEFMYRYLACVARENNNTAIQSAAWDNRVDVFSSVSVFLGIVLSNMGMTVADHVAAFLVSLLVIRIGGLIAWDALKGLLDVTVAPDALTEIARTSRMVLGVKDIQLIRGRSLGEYWEIYLHVSLDENLTIHAGQDIVAELKRRIRADFPIVQTVWVITVPAMAQDEHGGDYWTDHLFSLPRSMAVRTPADKEEGSEPQSPAHS